MDRRIKWFIILYVIASVLDTGMTYYFVGILRAYYEINPFSRIVMYYPNTYLLLQAVRELGTILLVVVTVAYYRLAFRTWNKQAVEYGVDLILSTILGARWLPVIYNIYTLLQA